MIFFLSVSLSDLFLCFVFVSMDLVSDSNKWNSTTKKLQNCTTPFLPEKFLSPAPSHVRTGRRSPRRPLNTTEVEKETVVKKLIAHVSAIFIHLVLEKSAIFSDFQAIAHGVGTRQDGDMVCCLAWVQRWTVDSMPYWFPWQHPLAWQLGVFGQMPPKMGLSARPYGPHRSILYPLQNYHCQTIGSALQALPLASIHRFPRNHNRNVRSGTRLSSVENAPGPNFSPFRCPPHGLGHTLLHSDHVECRNNDKLSEWSCVSIISTAKRLHNLTIKSNPKTNSLFLYHMQSLARFTCRPSNEITPKLYNNSFQSKKSTA